MLADGNQRWLLGRPSYRPPAERIDTAAHEVAAIDSDRTARAFVESHHYSRSYPAARFRFGLYERGELVGVAVFSHPVRDAVILNALPELERATDGVELGRFVLLDRVAGNGETWFLTRCLELLAGRVRGVVSFSDPVQRTTSDGAIVMPGHVGTIYQAANAEYLGRGRGDTLRLLPDGRALSRRTYQKIRDGARGWRPAAAQLEAFGADEPWHDRRAWLAHWIDRLTRPLAHPGNHRYAWRIDRRDRRARRAIAGCARPYPKAIDSSEIVTREQLAA